MRKLLLVVVAGLGALAFWRRDTLKEDVSTVSDAAKTGVARVKERAAETDADESAAADPVSASDIADASNDGDAAAAGAADRTAD